MLRNSLFTIRALLICLYLLATSSTCIFAQDNSSLSAPEEQNITAPIPGNLYPDNAKNEQSSYLMVNTQTTLLPNKANNGLPLSPEGLKAMVETIDAKQINVHTEETLNQLLNWTYELIKDHYKLSLVFSRQNNYKTAASNEHNLAKELQQIRSQLLYLKAQFLIRQNRSAEYLPILVDITASDPQSDLGQAAYKCLKQAGFSSEDQTPAIPKASRKATNTISSTNKQLVTH